jgi:sulfoxide reductase heme-binding subunit YedZ
LADVKLPKGVRDRLARMNTQVLWYVTRGSGAVSLVLLSAVVCLGLLTRLRVRGEGWPSFLTAAVHQDIALVAVVFLALHVITAVVDPFTSLGFVAAVVPFGSAYRTVWLGLGTLSLELGLAVGLTSLARRWIGPRLWRAIHWLAYLSWPMALVHALGTGTDNHSAWLVGMVIFCAGAVLICLLWRLVAAPPDPVQRVRSSLAMERERWTR